MYDSVTSVKTEYGNVGLSVDQNSAVVLGNKNIMSKLVYRWHVARSLLLPTDSHERFNEAYKFILKCK